MGHLGSRWLFLYLLILFWLRFPTSECSLIQNHCVIVLFFFSSFSFANIHALPGFFGAFHTVLPMWLRVRLLQSFFFPSFKNSVDEHFPVQKIIKPVFVKQLIILNIWIWHLSFVGESKIIFFFFFHPTRKSC